MYFCIMKQQDIIFTHSVGEELTRRLNATVYDKLFFLMDETTERMCWKRLEECPGIGNSHKIVIKASDTYKNVDSLCHVWEEMSFHGATRKSLLVNLGGGMVTDLGGFAASTFKRGIRFINIPTTLLAMVDASVGGKTGINFAGLKNEVGVFNNALVVIIDTVFLSTMDRDNICSGYAEMLKHGLISNEEHWRKLLAFDLENPDMHLLQDLVRASVDVKQKIVMEDPTERGMRKALNFGHTLGHAFESMAMEKGTPVLHGYAVAWGIIGELYMSHVRTHFPLDQMRQTILFIKEHYGTFPLDCKEYERVYELMTHDKKNVDGRIYCTLLNAIGGLELNQPLDKKDVFEMLDFFREG